MCLHFKNRHPTYKHQGRIEMRKVPVLLPPPTAEPEMHKTRPAAQTVRARGGCALRAFVRCF